MSYPQPLSITSQTPAVVINKYESREAKLQFLRDMAKEFKLPTELWILTLACESDLNPQAINWKDTDGIPKFGMAQFATSTFTWAIKKYKLPYDGDQILQFASNVTVAAHMWRDGLHRHWGTCLNESLLKLNTAASERFR